MKTTPLILVLLLIAVGVQAQIPPPPSPAPNPRSLLRARTNNAAVNFPAMPTLQNPAAAASAVPNTMPATLPSGLPASTGSANGGSPSVEVPGYEFTYEGVDVNQVLDVYANLVNRTLLRAGNLPTASIVLKTQQKLTKTEAIEALQAVLALNGIVVIPIGDKFVKVMPDSQAAQAGQAIDYSEPGDLPDLGSYVTHIVQLQYVKPTAMQGIISPLSKLNSIFPIDDNGILVIRDYAENVKRMLELIQQVDVSSPQEYTNEVINIKYALAGDIANALNSLGGQGGGSTVAIGGSPAGGQISGIGSPGQRNGVGAPGGASPFGGGGNPYSQRTTVNPQATATPAAPGGGGAATPGSTFQSRLLNIINNAQRTPGQQDQIQVFGQAKIIADERSNSLLIFATRADMDRIKAVIAKLDVLLAQVLIESVIMDVGLDKGWNFGVSGAQNPKILNGNPVIAGAGGMNNGQPFLNFLKNVTDTNGVITHVLDPSGGTNGVFTSLLPGGLSYFMNIGNTWDLAVTAAANDSSVNIIQRPRIQTSQAKAAQFFVGNTVPYITGTQFGTGYNGANSSTYSTLSVGIELDVTPFINPDGLVVMDIQQEIDDIASYQPIDGNNVPVTDKRTLSSEIAVKDKDTIMLGGFIRSDKSHTKTGVPLLQDIPLLGALFRQTGSTRHREELLVMMRPTVLRTPEIAAHQTLVEEGRLPGVSRAALENDAEEARQVAEEQKWEKKRASIRQKHAAANNYDNGGNNNDQFFTPVPSASPQPGVDTNLAVPLP